MVARSRRSWYRSWYDMIFWLVAYLPLWKNVRVRQLGLWSFQSIANKSCSRPQTNFYIIPSIIPKTLIYISNYNGLYIVDSPSKPLSYDTYAHWKLEREKNSVGLIHAWWTYACTTDKSLWAPPRHEMLGEPPLDVLSPKIIWLVVKSTPLKNMSSSVGMTIPNWMAKWN